MSKWPRGFLIETGQFANIIVAGGGTAGGQSCLENNLPVHGFEYSASIHDRYVYWSFKLSLYIAHEHESGYFLGTVE